MKKIYLAGPEIFLKNAIEIGEKKKEICAKYGFEGILPINKDYDENPDIPQDQLAYLLAGTCMDHIEKCDILIANMTPFRGIHMDVGTAFEMGYAAALGKIVCGYSNDSSFLYERGCAMEYSFCDDKWRDAEGFSFENWGLHDNLMLEGAINKTNGEFICGNYLNNLDNFEKLIKLISNKLS